MTKTIVSRLFAVQDHLMFIHRTFFQGQVKPKLADAFNLYIRDELFIADAISRRARTAGIASS